MTCPRVTKCGHLYCWPCLLQYLAYEREYAWKKCPLCADPIYKHDIRRVTILQSKTLGQDEGYFKNVGAMEEEEVKSIGFGKEIEFHLMIRNKSNINVKTKTDSIKILESRLPSVHDQEYSASRVLISDEKYIREMLQNDLTTLKANFTEKKRAKEDQLLPSVTEAIDYCEAQLSKKEGETLASDEDEPGFVNLQEQNKQKTLQQVISQKA